MFRYMLAALLSFGILGCAGRAAADPVVVQTEVVEVPTPPPAPVVENVVVVRPGYFWARGHWYWTGRWTWRPGYWAVARPGYRWVYPHHVWRGRRVFFVRGHWVR